MSDNKKKFLNLLGKAIKSEKAKPRKSAQSKSAGYTEKQTRPRKTVNASRKQSGTSHG